MHSFRMPELIWFKPIAKRRIALLKSISRTGEAIEALVQYLDVSPTDAEAWCELAELYLSEGSGSRAVFCLEEALLIVPNAWNVSLPIEQTQRRNKRCTNG